MPYNFAADSFHTKKNFVAADSFHTKKNFVADFLQAKCIF